MPMDYPSAVSAKRFLAAEALGLEDEVGPAYNPDGEAGGSSPRYLRGKRLAFVGDSDPIRSLAERAEHNGAPTVKNVTKTVLWVAADDVMADTRFHRRARELGIEVVDAKVAERRLNDLISEAEVAEFKRAQEIAAAEARYRELQAEQEAYWRHAWRRNELTSDPGPRDPWS